MVILAIVLLGLFILFAVLTKFAPQQSENTFWKMFSKNHSVIKHVFSILFLCLLVLAGGMIGYGVLSKSAGGGTSSLTTDAIITILICIGYFA